MLRNVHVNVFNRHLIQPSFTKLSVRFSNNNNDDNSKKNPLEDLEKILKFATNSNDLSRPRVIRREKIKKTVFDFSNDRLKEDILNTFHLSSEKSLLNEKSQTEENENIQEKRFSEESIINVVKSITKENESLSVKNLNKKAKANNKKENIQDANISGSEKRFSIEDMKFLFENNSILDEKSSLNEKSQRKQNENIQEKHFSEESLINVVKSITKENENLSKKKTETINTKNKKHFRDSEENPPIQNIKSIFEKNTVLDEKESLEKDKEKRSNIETSSENNVNENIKANNKKENIQDANISESEKRFSIEDMKFIFENNSILDERSSLNEKSQTKQNENIQEKRFSEESLINVVKSITKENESLSKKKTETINTKNKKHFRDSDENSPIENIKSIFEKNTVLDEKESLEKEKEKRSNIETSSVEEKANKMSSSRQDLIDLIDNLKYHRVYKTFNANYEISDKESFLEKKDPSKRLNIFQIDKIKEAQAKEQPESCLKIMDMVDSCEYRCFNISLPDTQIHEWIQLTKDKKMWTFPIDNEQDSEELKVGFHEHVFPQQYLSGKLPKTGLVGQFMNYVCLGLSQSPHLTVNDKKAHVKWFEEYLSNKLDEINKAEEKRIHDKQYEEDIKNK